MFTASAVLLVKCRLSMSERRLFLHLYTLTSNVLCTGCNERQPTFNKQVVDKFRQKAASRWADFSRGQCHVIPTGRVHCSRLQQWRCHAVIENWMIPFAAHSGAKTPNAFSGSDNPKIALSHGDVKLSTPSNSGSLSPCESAPNGISIGSAVFAGLSKVTNRQTDTQTDHDMYTSSVA